MKKTIPAILLLTCIQVFSANLFADATPAYEGRKLYVSYCQLCHGVGGKGDGQLSQAMKITPADLTTTVRSRSDTILTKIITGEGRQTITGRDRHNLLSDAMPEWKNIFNADQVKAIIAFLRFLSTSKHKLTGDPELGMQVYNKYCSVCHGEDGDGEGIMTNLIGISPMDHTNSNATNPLTNIQIKNSILNGTGRFMPAWQGILSAQEIDGVVSYIRLLSQ